jgi:cell division septal protein FtsQ
MLGVYVLWMLFCGTLVYLFLFSSFALVETTTVSGTEVLSQATLRGFVEGELGGKYFGIFPKRAFVITRPRVLEEHLRTEFPLLASVSVERIFPNSLRVRVTERKKIIVWQTGDMRYLVDENGVTHESTRALAPENAPFVITLTDTSGKSVGLGEQVFEPNFGAFVIGIQEAFPDQLGLGLTDHPTVVSRFADEVRATTEEGWEVFFNTDIAIDTSLDTLKLLFDKELPREKRLQLAYIDLRAENRAYYAFRDGAHIETLPPAVPDTPVSPTKKKKK